MNDPVIWLLGTFLCGGACGAFINAALARSLDRTKRRRDFHGFLEEWKTEVRNASQTPLSVGDVYFTKAAIFRGQCAHVEDCFRGKKLDRFSELSRKLGWITKEDLENKNTDPKKMVLGRINDILVFVTIQVK